MKDKNLGWAGSSEDSQKLADTVKGVIQVIGGLIAYFGYTQITGEVNTIADQVGSVVTLGVTFYGACTTLYGLIKKLVIKFAQK